MFFLVYRYYFQIKPIVIDLNDLMLICPTNISDFSDFFRNNYFTKDFTQFVSLLRAKEPTVRLDDESFHTI